MKLSVIIPVYQCEEYIDNCVLSLSPLNSEEIQTEVLLVDDGAFDKSPVICDNLAVQNENIIVIHKQNEGVSKARNIGINVADGDYLMFVDSDDTVECDKLNDVLKEVIINTKTDMLIFGISFDYYRKDILFKSVTLCPPVEGFVNKQNVTSIINDLFLKNCLSSIWAKIIKKSILTDNNLYSDESLFLFEDLEYVLRILKFTNKIYFYPFAIYRYKNNESANNSGKRAKRLKSVSELAQKLTNDCKALCIEDNYIPLTVFNWISTDKIKLSSLSECKEVCIDFKKWIDSNDYLSTISNKKYFMNLYSQKYLRVYIKLKLSKFKHSIKLMLKG